MQDPIDAYRQALTCSFCQNKFQDVIKVIPTCGNLICGACYNHVVDHLVKSREYRCKVCIQHHVLPENGMPSCMQLAGLVQHPIEKPLSEPAKELKLLIKTVHDEMTRLEAFDPRDQIERSSSQLELQVIEAANKAVDHIRSIEASLLNQIQTNRQQRLAELSAASAPGASRTSNAAMLTVNSALSRELNEFSGKWDNYFNRLNALASDAEVQAAIRQTSVFQARIRELDQAIRNGSALASMQFQPSTSFHAARDHLGELVEMPAQAIRAMRRDTRVQQVASKASSASLGASASLNVETDEQGLPPKRRREQVVAEPRVADNSVNHFRIQETALKTLKGHSGCIDEVVFLPDGRLASCSSDKKIKVWDSVDAKELCELKGHTGWIYTIALLSNGWLASGSSDKTIKAWDLTTRKVVRTLKGHTASVVSLKALKNGNLASYSTDGTIKIWNVCSANNNLLLTISGHGNERHVIPLGVLSNDSVVACSLGDDDDEEESILRVWDPKDGGKLVQALSTQLQSILPVLVLSNDQIAIGTDSGTIRVIDLKDASRSKQRENAHDMDVTCLLQLPNDNLISAGLDGDPDSTTYSIKLFRLSDLSELQHIRTNHSGIIYSMSISDDRKWLATGSGDKKIKLWPIIAAQNA